MVPCYVLVRGLLLFSLCCSVDGLFSADACGPCCRMDWMDWSLKVGNQYYAASDSFGAQVVCEALTAAPALCQTLFYVETLMESSLALLFIELVTGLGPGAYPSGSRRLAPGENRDRRTRTLKSGLGELARMYRAAFPVYGYFRRVRLVKYV